MRTLASTIYKCQSIDENDENLQVSKLVAPKSNKYIGRDLFGLDILKLADVS